MPNKTTTNLTITNLVGTGTPFWFVEKDSNSNASKSGWRQGGDTVSSAGDLFFADTIIDLIDEMDTQGINVPASDHGVNIDEDIDQFGLEATQIESLTVPQLAQINNKVDRVLWCKHLGNFTLCDKMFRDGPMNWIEYDDITIYLGQKKKVTRSKVESKLNNLENNGHITALQKNGLLNKWDQQVGTNL